MSSFCSRTLAVAAAAVLVAACGGGGDGGAPPPPPPQVRITMTNQDAVAVTSILAVSAFDGLPGIHLATAPSPVRPASASVLGTTQRVGLTHALIQAIGARLQQPVAAADGTVRALASVTLACPVSGSVDMNLIDRDNSGTLTPGDTLSMAFSQCVYMPGSSYNGLMAITFDTLAMSASGFDVTGPMSFQQLTMIDDALSLTLNGATNARLAETHVVNGANEIGSYTVTGAGLTLAAAAPGYSDRITYSPGFSFYETAFIAAEGSGLTDQGTLRAAGEFHSEALGGTLVLATVQDFRFDSSIDYPLEGQMTATGASNTMLSLAATGGPMGRIDVCDDGDGEWEATKLVDWNML